MPYATYRFNKIIAAETIRFIVTVAIVVYKGLKLVVYRMLTNNKEGVFNDSLLIIFHKELLIIVIYNGVHSSLGSISIVQIELVNASRNFSSLYY